MKARRFILTMSVLAGVATLFGCASASKAPLTASGKKIQIAVLSDRGNESEMESRQWQYRIEVGSYLETDLIRRLNGTGYAAKLISSQNEFVPGEDAYLIKQTIKSYNPGSSAARMVVGFGAGACSLDMHYELVGKESKTLMDWDDGIGSSSDWRRLCIALNDKLARKLNAELPTL